MWQWLEIRIPSMTHLLWSYLVGSHLFGVSIILSHTHCIIYTAKCRLAKSTAIRRLGLMPLFIAWPDLFRDDSCDELRRRHPCARVLHRSRCQASAPKRSIAKRLGELIDTILGGWKISLRLKLDETNPNCDKYVYICICMYMFMPAGGKPRQRFARFC